MSTYAVRGSFIWLFKSKRACPSLNRKAQGTFLVVQWLRLGTPHAGGPGAIPGQGTRPYMPQLKIPRAATKAWCSQIKRKKCIPKTGSTYLHRSGEALCSQKQGCQVLWDGIYSPFGIFTQMAAFPLLPRLVMASLVFAAMSGCWRRQWHPTPVLLPRKSHGWRSLVGCCPWGC